MVSRVGNPSAEEPSREAAAVGATVAGDARRKSPREAVEFLLVCGAVAAFGLTAIFFLVSQITGKTAGTRDFVVYWATGQQLAHGADPYDREALFRIERAAGLPKGFPAMFMRNPPWTLPLTLPLGYVSLRTGALLWTGLLLGSLGLSVQLLWRLRSRPRSRVHWLGYSFAPGLLCLIVGQTAVFALLGYVLFLRWHRSRPFLAGASLWLCALKPHLFVPAGVALAAWILVRRSYRLAAGAFAALGVSCVLLCFIDPLAWTQYARMLRTSGIELDRIPCLSVMLRLWTFPQAIWLQYVPAALGCAWAIAYFWPRRTTWDWLEDGNLLLLVSMLTAPYAWIMDEVVAIPAVLGAAYAVRSRTALIAIALASAAVEIEFLSGIRIPSLLYLWTAPGWLLMYWMARRFALRKGRAGAGQAEEP